MLLVKQGPRRFQRAADVRVRSQDAAQVPESAPQSTTVERRT